MTKKTKKIIIFVTSIISVGLVSFVVYKLCFPSVTQTLKVDNTYYVSIDGAVKNPGSYKFDKPKTIREIIFNANVLTEADISTLELEKVIKEDCEIVVPYKVNSIKKIKWKDLHSVEQLTKLGIKTSVAQTIINHRRQNETTTWEEILALKGIGQVTLAQLKDVIDLS